MKNKNNYSSETGLNVRSSKLIEDKCGTRKNFEE
tara:strand:+ start:1425 stop:1526 length:102 start_codon:yes stop_codon:yes gene_type:complete